MTYKILIMGLPGSGKTTLSSYLHQKIGGSWVNADVVRKMANDWDFSDSGRLRQANRLKNISEFEEGIIICDFICPSQELIDVYSPDFTIWMDTIESSRFEDTNTIFSPPKKYDIRIMGYKEINIEEISKQIQANLKRIS